MYINRTRRVLPGIFTYNSGRGPFLYLSSFALRARARETLTVLSVVDELKNRTT